MRILHWHILKTVVSMTALVILLIASIEMFVAFLSELDDIGHQGYGVYQAFIHVLCSVPSLVYPLFPAAALMGCLIGLGRLAAQSELVVMQASGISKMQITYSVLRAAVLMLLVVTAIGEGLNPHIQQFAEQYKLQAMTGNVDPEDRKGLWIRDGENFIYIQQILPSGKLLSVLRYQFDQTKLRIASYAKQGNYLNKQWVFSDVTDSIFLDNTIKTRHANTQVWPIALDPDFAGVANIDPAQASLPQLTRYIRYLTKSGLYTKSYEFQFWQRLLQPLTALVMIGLAVPFIFGPLRTKPMGFRILVGVIIGFGFYTFNEFVGPFSLLYQIPPFVAAFVPLLLFIGIDWVLLRVAR